MRFFLSIFFIYLSDFLDFVHLENVEADAEREREWERNSIPEPRVQTSMHACKGNKSLIKENEIHNKKGHQNK